MTEWTAFPPGLHRGIGMKAEVASREVGIGSRDRHVGFASSR